MLHSSSNIFIFIFYYSNESDEVERSLDVLDKVLLEFEDEPESSPEVQPKSPTQGHQSEDDGYMSLNGKRWGYLSFILFIILTMFQIFFIYNSKIFRAKFVPDFQPTEEIALPSVLGDKNFSPPTPEEANRVLSHLLPRWEFFF